MQQLAGDMAPFTYAMWLQEYDAMAEHAGSMASHTPLSPGEIQRIETELGPDMHAFEEVDEAVHRASVRLLEAAQARQLDEVLMRLNEVQRGCMSCHNRLRDRLRTDTAVDTGQE